MFEIVFEYFCHIGITLRVEILAGINLVEQFGRIYFGGSKEKFNLAGINFGGFPE